MKKLTPKAHAYVESVFRQVVGGSGITGVSLYDAADNPFSYIIEIPDKNSEGLVVRTCNELFHALELLPQSKDIAIGELGDYCNIIPPHGDGCYAAIFNHPAVFALKETDSESRLKMAA